MHSAEWLELPGTVGRPFFGELHIVGEDGNDLPTGEEGPISFAAGRPLEYHNDPEKTRSAHVRQATRRWATSDASTARVTLRPIGSPLPLGMFALIPAGLLLAGLQLGWWDSP